MFGKTEVESRVNISRARFNTLECVATVEGEQAYILYSISGELNSRIYIQSYISSTGSLNRGCGIKGGVDVCQFTCFAAEVMQSSPCFLCNIIGQQQRT